MHQWIADAITTRDGVNLHSLHLLNTSLSLNDLADALEAMHVRASWQGAAKLNVEAEADQKRQRDAMIKQARAMASGGRR